VIKLVEGEEPRRFIKSDAPEALTTRIATEITKRFIFLEIIRSAKRKPEGASMEDVD
jgi:hypothetical protein